MRYDLIGFTSLTSVRLDVNEDVGSLTINFGVDGEKVEVLKSDALVLLTFLDGKIADIEILFDDKSVVNKLKKLLGPDSDRH